MPVVASLIGLTGLALGAAQTAASIAAMIQADKHLDKKSLKRWSAIDYLLTDLTTLIPRIKVTMDDEVGQALYQASKYPSLTQQIDETFTNVGTLVSSVQSSLETLNSNIGLSNVEAQINRAWDASESLIQGYTDLRNDDIQQALNRKNLISAALIADNLTVFRDKGDWKDPVGPSQLTANTNAGCLMAAVSANKMFNDMAG